MFVIIGAVVVTAAVMGGFLMEGGHPLVLLQPAEFIIIGGAMIGSLVIGTPPKVLKMMLTSMKKFFSMQMSRADYLDLLAMLYQLFRVVQQSGIMALEAHFEKPGESAIV